MSGTETLYQISLLAAFIAGMVALFAPCCISYLFPAYLANIFKEKKQVLFMTFIYSLGIFTVMLPIVLGARALSALFMNLHDYTYIVGGTFMMLVGVMSFLGLKLPMINLSMKQKTGNPDVISTYTLGIFSGITSSCCAPVLIGVMALSSLSASMLNALGVGMAYVFGMVTPLYLASLFINKRNILEKPILRKKLSMVRIFNKEYPIFVNNMLAASIFFVTGILMIVLSSTGMLGMSSENSSVTKNINSLALVITNITNKIPGINIIFLIIISYLIYKLLKEIFGKNKAKSNNL